MGLKAPPRSLKVLFAERLERGAPEHDPEKHVLDLDRGWGPVFGQSHAQAKCYRQ